jgi:hypothetical protein
LSASRLCCEDLIDHDELSHDPVTAVLACKLAATRSDGAVLVGKSTLNRLELGRAEPTRYAKIAADTGAIEALPVDLFLDAQAKPPKQITLEVPQSPRRGSRNWTNAPESPRITNSQECVGPLAGCHQRPLQMIPHCRYWIPVAGAP